jgi:O-antigen/teichoic acid export membrane protein
MGVVRRQSLISSAFIYLGFAIGAVNILLLFPHFFTPEQIGLTRILLDVAMVMATVCTLGAVPVTLRFFPFFRSRLPADRNDLPFLSLALGAMGCLLMALMLPTLKPLIIRKFGARSPLFVEYFELLYPLTVSLVFFAILEAHAWSWRRTVLSNALKEFGFRILTTLTILAFAAGWIGFEGFINLYAWVYLPLVVVLAWAIGRMGGLAMHLRPSRVTRRLKDRMASFGLFMLGGAILNIVARTNDTIILASQSSGGLADAAVFTIATYLVTVMDVPQRSLISISTPFIAEAWKDRDMPRIARLYQKTSLNLMLAGLAIFCVVLLNVGEAEARLGKGYEALSWLVIVSGLGKMADLATGLNTQVLLLSKYWKVDFLTNLLLVALSIPLNYWLTRRYDVMGPAYGNLVSLVVFNLTRLLLIWRFFRMQPFSIGHWKALLAGVTCLILGWLIPSTGWPIADCVIKTFVFCLIFIVWVVKARVSEDFSHIIFIGWARLIGKGGK